jgi:hypothetical protein
MVSLEFILNSVASVTMSCNSLTLLYNGNVNGSGVR